MAKAKLEELRILQGDPDDYDMEDLDRMRAYKMMPRWGQLLAWIAWELPWPVFFTITGGGLFLFYAWTWVWKVALVLCAAIALFMRQARQQTSPFRRFVIVTKRIVPGDVAAAATRGEAPPETRQ